MKAQLTWMIVDSIAVFPYPWEHVAFIFVYCGVVWWEMPWSPKLELENGNALALSFTVLIMISPSMWQPQ